MDYPEWAPKLLIERHRELTNSKPSERKFKSVDPEATIADWAQNHDFSEENIEHMRRKLYRQAFGGLPDNEQAALLKKLISDLRMKDVWRTLSKRIQKDQGFWDFFRACQGGITGWRGDQKQTTLERRKFYQEIHDTAGRLQFLMYKADAFDFYSITNLVKNETIEWLLETLDASFSDAIPDGQEDSYARFCLSDVIPSAFEVLNDIGKKAKQYGEEVPSVKKPNSPNAQIHYFARSLSGYCQKRYEQPLHEVVAITTSVVFDEQNIDTDYIRKIVKR
ncbi:MAG: hypothetical protein NTX56_07790 [Proteobacteria bacterium]|nr:hypothetical protein [Pseudomonadota bacterium]